MQENEEISIKAIILGKESVGKTCLIASYFERTFTYQPNTLGVSLKVDTYYDRINKRTFKLNVWDTCGMERYMAINSVYCRDANIVILVVDASDQNTLSVAENYLKLVRDVTVPFPNILLVINKIDLLSGFESGVPPTETVYKTCTFYEKIIVFANKNHLDQIFWISPLENGLNVNLIFEYIFDELLLKKCVNREIQTVDCSVTQKNYGKWSC